MVTPVATWIFHLLPVVLVSAFGSAWALATAAAPAAAQRIETLLQALAGGGRTVLFSAHDLSLVARLNCDVWLLTPGGQVEPRRLETLDPRAFQLVDRQPELPPWLG